MKKLRSVFTADIIRPVLYKCVSRCSVALAVVLLWNRYVNIGSRLRLSDGAFAAGLVFLGLAWKSYLRLDGVTFHYLLEERQKKKKPKRHSSSDIVDFADEHIVSYEELSEEERSACTFAANLLSALLFLAPALIAMLFGK